MVTYTLIKRENSPGMTQQVEFTGKVLLVGDPTSSKYTFSNLGLKGAVDCNLQGKKFNIFYTKVQGLICSQYYSGQQEFRAYAIS